MQALTVAIDIEPRDIPDLLCTPSVDDSRLAEYVTALAVAEELGLQEFLSRPDRVHELRRILWERDEPANNRRDADKAVGPVMGPFQWGWTVAIRPQSMMTSSPERPLY